MKRRRGPRTIAVLCPECGSRLGECVDVSGDEDRRVVLRERVCPACGRRWMLVETLFPDARQEEERRRLRRLRTASRQALRLRTTSCAEA